MSNAVFPILRGVKKGSRYKTPIFKTKVQTTVSDRELRTSYSSYPRWQFSLAFEYLRASQQYQEWQALLGFFLQRSGDFDSWLYDDPDDDQVVAQEIGVGDGSTTQFQLVRNMGGFVEPILNPDVDTVQVFRNDWQGNQLLYPIARTQLLKYSEALDNAVWTRTNLTTVTPSAAAAPDGSNNADLIVLSATLGSHYISQTVTAVDNAYHSGSVFVKQDTVKRVLLGLYNKAGANPWLEYRFEDDRIIGATVSSANTDTIFSVERRDDGWIKLKLENMNMKTGSTAPLLRVYAGADIGVGDASYSKTNCTATRAVAGETSPIAGWNVDQLVESTTASVSHYASIGVTLVAGRTYRARAYFKTLSTGAAKRYASMLFTSSASSAFTGTAPGIVVDTATGTYNTYGTQAPFNVSVVDAGNGFWLATFDVTAAQTAGCAFRTYISNGPTATSPSYTGDGSSGILVCSPYVIDVDPANRDTPIFTTSSSGSVLGDATTGFYVWGAHLVDEPQVGAYIQTTSAPVTVTDYVLTGPAEKGGGVVTLARPAAANAVLTWTGKFFYRCRFLQGKMELNRFLKNFWSANKVEFISLK